MKKTIALTLMLALAAISFTGCMSYSTGIAPSTTPITAKDSYTVLGDSVSGTGWGVSLLVLPLSESTPSKNARDRAIKNGGGNGLIEVSEYDTYWFLYFATIVRTKVTGTPVRIERGAL